MSGVLAGKVVIVTGGSRNIGLARRRVWYGAARGSRSWDAMVRHLRLPAKG
jgi:NAD(P)-dependent dehydrogenase (short-subunit alcohol dehydrogenase family)